MVNIEKLKGNFVFDEPEPVLNGFQNARDVRVSSLLQELGSMGDDHEDIFIWRYEFSFDVISV